MNAVKEILQAQADTKAKELFIRENLPFIRRCAALAAGHFVDESDDVFSEALAAFHSALMNYKDDKGNFKAFAKTCIQNRINDYYRKQNRHGNVIPFSSLSNENDNGDEIVFEIEDTNSGVSDTALEIYSLKSELEPFGISFFDLPDAAPKFKRTRRLCTDIVRYITADKSLVSAVYAKKTLPVKQVSDALNINKKVLERHRKYIIMGILIINGEYEILSEYFDSDYGR